MREHKFRGIRYDNKEWVYGSLHDYSPIGRSIYVNSTTDDTVVGHMVWGYTVGEFTGLKDKNGVDIYEGDICVCHYGIDGNFQNVAVYHEKGCFYVNDKHPAGNLPLWFVSNPEDPHRSVEVVGNIHENPELLK